jgi:NADPH-dependent 2,4-dienoyl-CoA reductase/sulfur reductase-like enzyme
MTDPVVVIGAGLAGWRVADAVLTHRPGSEVIVLGSESLPPYDRPPLSKQALMGERAWADLELARSSEGDIELRLGEPVIGVDGKHVLLQSGERISAGHIVWATGVSPIRPAWVPEAPEVHVLRTVADSQGLSASMTPSRSLVVIGGGFIGCEVAAAGAARAMKVTVIEMADQLLPGAAHEDVARLVQALHHENGVDVRTSERVLGIDSNSGGTVVRTDRAVYRADAVVVGIGASVDAGPLGGLPIVAGGIACDDRGRVEALERTWAVGDVAAWHDPVLGEHRRREHWTTATQQASIVAMGIAGVEVPDALLKQPPYAWSDQYGLKVQILGWPEAGGRSEWLEKDGATGAIGYFSDDYLAGVMTVGAPRLLMKHRAAVNAFALSRSTEGS